MHAIDNEFLSCDSLLVGKLAYASRHPHTRMLLLNNFNNFLGKDMPVGPDAERRKEGFEFKECAIIRKSTGKKAATLREFRRLLMDISEKSLYYHIYQYFLKQKTSEYTNDFARWAGEFLEERALAEQLSNVDPYAFKDVSSLRNELLAVIDRYQEQFPEPRDAVPGNEFYFKETLTFTFLVGVKARNLAEFLLGIKYVDISSIYYHFYEARVRQGMDDFSVWIEDSLEEKVLAEKIRALDPFMHSLDRIRDYIAAAVEQTVRVNMESL